jgi:DNA-binding transcriptional LysR family regulator
MELRQLEYFATVAEEANFTRAAARVHISQSGDSAQIKALENELGADLFDRSGRTARLTEAGREALPFARAALGAVTGLRQVVDEVRGVIRGRLTVGMVTACEVKPLFAALAAFHRDHPAIDLELVEDDSRSLLDGVHAGRYDVALVGIAGSAPEHLCTHVIVEEGLVALTPPGSDLAGAGRVPIAQLTAYPLVTMPQGTGIRAVLDDAFQAQGLVADVALVASAPAAVADLAARGMGVAVLSASMAAGFGELTAVPIDDVPLRALLALVWRPKAGAALNALLPHLKEEFA